MKINYSRRFLKNYKERIKPNPKLKSQFYKKLQLFKKDRDDSALKDHRLTGKLSEYRAFSIASDVRVVYMEFDGQVLFYDIGTHNQVY